MKKIKLNKITDFTATFKFKGEVGFYRVKLFN